MWAVLWVGKNSPSELRDCVQHFKNRVWSCVPLFKEDFGNISVRSKSPETLLQGFKSCNVQICVRLMVYSHGIMSTKMTPSASKKTVAITFRAEGVALNFFFQG